MLEYHYTNSYGIPKILNIDETPNAEGKYHCILWRGDNGELCGGCDLTLDEIKDYFEGCHIKGTFNPKQNNEGE